MPSQPEVVTAFTHASDEYMLPPQFAVGQLVVRLVRSDYLQYFVGGVMVDGDAVAPLPDPSPDLVRALERKAAAWATHDRLLARRREQEDDGFREDHVDEEYEVHLVRADQQEAFAAFCDRMRAEDRRLVTERQAEVAELVRTHRRAGR